jgi:hypothetical protein
MAFLAILLAFALCNWTITENQRAHAEFVATVDYLQPRAIKHKFSGKRVLTPSKDAQYDSEGNLSQSSQSEISENWSYDVLLSPVTRVEAVNGRCEGFSDRPGCEWSYYAMTVIAEKDGQKYVTVSRWQSGTGYDPEAWFVQEGFSILKTQYFVLSRNDLYLNPVFNDPIKDIDHITGPWISAVGEREGIPQLP